MHRKKLIVTFIAVAVCAIVDAQSQQDIEAMSKAAVQKQVVSGHKVKEESREQDVKAGVIQKRNANFSISILEGSKGCVKRKRSAIEDKMRRIDDYLKDFDWHGSFISGLVNKWRMALSDIKEPTTIEEAQEMLNDMFWVEESVSYVFDWLRTNKAKRDEAKSLGKIVTPVTEDELAKALTTKVTLDLARSYISIEEWENGIAELEKVLSWDADNTEAKQLKRAAESHLVPKAKAVAMPNGENRKAEEAAGRKVAEDEARSKAEEEARQKAAAEEAKCLAEEAARQKAAAEEAERIAKASATEIRIEARVQQSAVRNISDEDGFRAKKDKLAQDFVRADALFDEKVKRWSEAAVLFTNYVGGCKALLTLDGERQTAKDARTKAGAAKDSAEKAEAEKYARARWSVAVRLLDSANAEFARMQFSSASGTFASAERQFGICATDAKTEKKRQEDAAAAQAQAEKEARERAEAEARARAEKEARERERRAKWHKDGEEFTINEPYGLNMTMKWCPAGSFTMGSPATEDGRYDDETQHQVTLTKGFWLGQTEVTQGQWKKIMDGETIVDLARKGLQDDTEYMISGKKQTLREFWKMDRNGDPNNRCGDLNDNVPVYNVNWHEAVEFCRRLTQRERAEGRIPDGYEYRLPTEAEWEYACRAGTTTALPNGRDISILGKGNAPALDDIAWYGGNSSVGFNGRGLDTSNWPEKQYPGRRAFAREIKGKQPNRWGLYDMIGNVWEWCGDWYGAYPYGSATDPTGAETGASRVSRGGSWSGIARGCRSARRAGVEPGCRNGDLGFRVALAPSH